MSGRRLSLSLLVETGAAGVLALVAVINDNQRWLLYAKRGDMPVVGCLQVGLIVVLLVRGQRQHIRLTMCRLYQGGTLSMQLGWICVSLLATVAALMR